MTTDVTLAEKLQAMYTELGQRIAAGEPADELIAQYAEALETHKKEIRKSNETAITNAQTQLAAGIHTLVDNLGVAKLLGESVKTVNFYYLPNDDGTSTPNVSINKQVRRGGTRTGAGAAGTTARGKKVKLMSTDDNGVVTERTVDLKTFVGEFASDETKNNQLFKSGKWPTKPAFVADAEKQATATNVAFEHVENGGS